MAKEKRTVIIIGRVIPMSSVSSIITKVIARNLVAVAANAAAPAIAYLPMLVMPKAEEQRNPKKRPRIAPNMRKGPKTPPAIGLVIARNMRKSLNKNREKRSRRGSGFEGESDPIYRKKKLRINFTN